MEPDLEPPEEDVSRVLSPGSDASSDQGLASPTSPLSADPRVSGKRKKKKSRSPRRERQQQRKTGGDATEDAPPPCPSPAAQQQQQSDAPDAAAATTPQDEMLPSAVAPALVFLCAPPSPAAGDNVLLPPRADRSPDPQHLGVGQCGGGRSQASDQPVPPTSPIDFTAVTGASYLSATSSDGGRRPLSVAIPMQGEGDVSTAGAEGTEQQSMASSAEGAQTVAQSPGGTAARLSPRSAAAPVPLRPAVAHLALFSPEQPAHEVKDGPGGGGSGGVGGGSDSPRTSKSGRSSRDGRQAHAYVSVSTPRGSVRSSSRWRCTPPGQGLLQQRGGARGIAIQAAEAGMSPSPKNPPASFLVGRNKKELLTWWEHFKILLRDTPADQAVGELGRNFDLEEKRKVVNTATSFFALLAIVIAIVNYDMKLLVLDAALSVVTILHILLLVRLYHIWYHKERLLKKDFRTLYPSFTASPSFAYLVLHGLAVLIHAPPFIADYGHARLINLVVLFRGLECLVAISHYTLLGSAGSSLVAALAGQHVGPVFVYKMLLFKYPVLTIIVSSLSGFLALSVLVWFVENAANDWSFATSMWYTIVTFTTVGYGDTVPESAVGKLAGVISAIFGITASAVLVSVVQHKLALSRVQKQIIMFLCEVQRSHKIKEVSATIIARSLQYNQLLRRCGAYIPEHRSVTGWVSVNSRTRILNGQYLKLVDAAHRLKGLRGGEEGTAWADISVLDVLHADSSDILAQNTVLQYLMRPADESLSNQFRQNKWHAFRSRKQSQSEDPAAASMNLGSTAKVMASSVNSSSHPMMGTAAAVDSEVLMYGHAGAGSHSTLPVQQREMPSVSECDFDDTSTVYSVDTDVSFRSTGMRTAASTKALVDMVRLVVQNQPPVPQPPPQRGSPGGVLSSPRNSQHTGGGSPRRSNLRKNGSLHFPDVRSDEEEVGGPDDRSVAQRQSTPSIVGLMSDPAVSECAESSRKPPVVPRFRTAARKVVAARRVVSRLGRGSRVPLSARTSTSRDSTDAIHMLHDLKSQYSIILQHQEEQGAMLRDVMKILSRLDPKPPSTPPSDGS